MRLGNHSKKSQQFEYKKVIMIKYSILTDEENVFKWYDNINFKIDEEKM